MSCNRFTLLALATTLSVAGLVMVSAERVEASPRGAASIGISNGRFQIGARFDLGSSRYRRGPRVERRRSYERVHHHTACCQVIHRPGYWKVERVPVWKAGHYETVQIPARYEVRYDSCGNPYRVLVEPACSRRVFVKPGLVYEERRLWVEGSTVYSCGY